MATQTPTRNAHTAQRRRPKKIAAQTLKLVVVGAHRSGKTQLMQTISQYTEWQGEQHKSWFWGRVRVDEDLILHFMEPPMGRQLDLVWFQEVVERVRANGYLLVLDSTRPQHFGQFVSLLYTIRGYHEQMPLVVAANKQDDPRAWHYQDIQLGLGLQHVTVMPCIANNYDLVRDVVVNLLHQVWETSLT